MEKLFELLPELEQIKDEGLRAKTFDCWHHALELGGWRFPDLHQMPFTQLIPDCPVSFLQHVRAVTQTALATAGVLSQFYHRHYRLDMDIIAAGGLLHDIGKLLEYHPDGGVSPGGRLLRHPFTGVGLAMQHGLPDEVVHIIATHAGEGDGGYRSPEAVIIHHADYVNFEPLRSP
jgi:putative nucleotidyltransferase with HDIG domain